MKKEIFLLLLLIPVTAYSQHLKVKGVEITGNVSAFTKSLVSKGLLNHGLVDSNVTELNGDFAGYKDCLWYIFNTPITKTVYRVMIVFPLQSSCDEAVEQLSELRAMIKEKYHIEYNEWIFIYPTECMNHGYSYDIEDGQILLKILPSKNVAIEYSDTQNIQLDNTETKKVKLNDL